MGRLMRFRMTAVELGAAAGVFRLARALQKPKLSVLTYHGFIDHDRRYVGQYAYLYRYCVSADRLGEQISFLKRTAHIVDAEEFLHIVDTGVVPRHSVLLTIDDALRSVIDVALPVFAVYDIRPIILVPTNGPNTAESATPWTQWHESLAGLILTDATAIAGSWRNFKDILAKLPLSPNGDALTMIKVLREAAWSSDSELHTELIRRAREAVGREPDPDLLRYSETSGLVMESMTWNQIRTASLYGAEIGGHTITHPRLSLLSNSSLKRELTQSAVDIEKQIGTPCRFFALPYGHPADFHPSQAAVLAQAGYHVAFTQEGGPCALPPQPLHISRTGIESVSTQAQVEFFTSRRPIRIASEN